MRFPIVVLGLLLAASPGTAFAVEDLQKLMLQCRAAKHKDCRKLAEIARSDKDEFTRRDAVSRLDDPVLLAELARGEVDSYVRSAAIENPRLDAAVLAEIALDPATNDAMRLEVARRIKDRAVLKRLIEAYPGSEAAVNALNYVEDPSVFVAVLRAVPPDARSHERARTGLGARIDKIEDQALLAEIARMRLPPKQSLDFGQVQVAAVGRITDPAVLVSIAVESTEVGVISAALKRVTDEAGRGKIAQTAADHFIGREALEKVTTVSILEQVARFGKHPRTRTLALVKAKTSDAALQNDVLLQVLRDRDWYAFGDLAALKIGVSPESKQALQAVTEDGDQVRANTARAMLAGVPRSLWPRVDVGYQLKVEEIGRAPHVPPGKYTLHVTYETVGQTSVTPVPLAATFGAGKCYAIEAVVDYLSKKWGPKVGAKACK